MAGKKGSKESKALKDGWVEIEGSQIEGWEEGKSVTGKFMGLKQGSFENPLAKVLAEDGTMRTLGCPTILANRLESVAIGDQVRIKCLGKTTTGSGREAWDFRVAKKPQPVAAAAPETGELPF